VTATDVLNFSYNTTLASKKDNFLTQNRKRLKCLNFSFLARPSFTPHSNEMLAEQNWCGFQKEGNFYCLKASCVNNGYENELLLSVQNTKICTQTWSVTDIKLSPNKLILNIYQNLISTDVQFMAKNVLSTPAACPNHWYQISTTDNTFWVRNGTVSIPRAVIHERWTCYM